jgi:hypothetical protein
VEGVAERGLSDVSSLKVDGAAEKRGYVVLIGWGDVVGK